MKKFLSLLLVAVMLVGMVSTLSGCGKKDAEIRIYIGDQIYDFDPALAFVDDNVSRVMSLIFEPLFLLDEDGDVVPGLAESYEIIEDEERGLYQMEITLRETYWNDGKAKVTADDIYFAWTRILDPEFKSQAAPLLYDVKNAAAVKQDKEGISRNDVGLEANRDVLTITFEGKIDYDAFLRNLTSVALSPLRENKVTEGDPDEEYWAKSSAFIATNGPFAIRSWNRSTGEFALRKNEYYHVSEPEEGNKTKDVYPAQIQMQWTDENYDEDYRGNMNKFLKNTFNKMYSLTEIAEEAIFCVGAMPLDKDLRLAYYDDAEIFDAFSTYSFIFNTNKAPFDNENVRKALSMVIDREYLASELVFAKAADGLISPAVWDSVKKKTSFRSEAESLIATEANLAAARALLADVDTSVTIKLTVRETVEERLIAEHVEEKWSELGFNVDVNYVTVDTEVWASEKGKPGRTVEVGSKVTVYDDGIQAAYVSGEFDVLGLDYNMYSTNAFTALAGFSTLLNGNGVEYYIDESTGLSVAENRLHCSGFSDATYDALIDKALAEKDLKKRAEILHEAEAYLLEKMPITPIVYNQNYYLVEKIGGLDFDGYGNLVLTHAKLRASIPEAEAPKSKED